MKEGVLCGKKRRVSSRGEQVQEGGGLEYDQSTLSAYVNMSS
jgi:hypothetical protein